MMVGPEIERTAIIRHCCRLFVTGANVSVPMITIVLRKGYGLGAQAIARGLQGLAEDTIPPLYYAKGNYFTLKGASPFSRLIYPVPERDALGVHVVLDLSGRTKFGPDIEWVETPDYNVPADRARSFYESVRRYWPALPDGALEPGYAGVRPKLTPAGAGISDFVIQGPETHAIAGLVNARGGFGLDRSA